MGKMPCGLDDERLWDRADAMEAAREQRVEDFADNLLTECATAEGAARVNRAYDLYDVDLIEKMMVAVANWTGRSDSAAEQMKKLHNILADALQEVAESEVE